MENGWSLRLVLPLLAAALMADFGVRQIYLWGKRPPTAPGGPQGQATHPGRAVPHPDPQQIGAKPDRTHPYYHHGWPIYDRSEETWRGRRYLHLTDSRRSCRNWAILLKEGDLYTAPAFGLPIQRRFLRFRVVTVAQT